MLSGMDNLNLLTVIALARKLGLSATWLKAEARAGRIPSLKIGRHLRFNADAVQRALLARAAGEDWGSEGSEIDMPGRENIILELHALASDRPVETRLRWVLKQLLRQQQFRCVRISSGSDTLGDTESADAAEKHSRQIRERLNPGARSGRG